MVIWKKYNGALIPDQPPHIRMTDSQKYIGKLVKSKNAFFARWTTEFDKKLMTNFWFVINDRPLDINDYSSNTRSKIRRGLKNLDVKKIKKSELISKGYTTYKEAFKRYKNLLPQMNKSEFKAHILGLDKTWDIWGVFHKDGGLIAYSQNQIRDNQCTYSIIKFHVDYLRYYPSYALYYTMNKYYLKEMQLNYVNEGTRSILHETNVQEFIIDKFKFRKAYCILNIHYHPLVRVIIWLLFPFRDVMLKFKKGILHKMAVVLKQEEIRRNQK